jgi:predicted lipoprotein with Yx(FWY)xxD motif
MSRSFLRSLLLALSLLPLFASAEVSPSDPPIRQREGILVDLKGRGLYTYDGDVDPKRSLCNDQCRLLWPPIPASAEAKPKGQFTVVARQDGTRQWAYKGKPLYRWVSDQKRGDAGGDGIMGVWHLVHLPPPVPNLIPAPQAQAPAGKGGVY